MSTLEDKLLGEKTHYYCSSSESEAEEESGDENEAPKTVETSSGPPPVEVSESGSSTNTGPKGVIKDWQKFKQLEVEQKEERERERLALIQKLSLTCRSDLDQEKEENPELSEFLEDAFLLEYSKRRMEEMLNKANELPKFGRVINLTTGQEFLDAIDKENKSVIIIVHIYEEKVPACKMMNECLKELCKDYPEVKFCKILASAAGVSKNFKVSGVPALLVYKNGSLVGNYVKLSEEFGNEFTSADVENFLIENGMIFEKSCISNIIKQSVSQNNEGDDGDEFD